MAASCLAPTSWLLVGTLVALAAAPCCGVRSTVSRSSDSAAPTFVDPQVNSLEGRAAQAVLENLRQKGRSTLFRAQTGAATAAASKNQVQYLSVQAAVRETKLQDMLARSTAAGNDAVKFEKQARRDKEEMIASKPAAVEQAKLLAVQAVQDLFKEKFRALRSWRDQALEDPYAEAITEAKRAVAPFDRNLTQTYAKIGEYRAEAQVLRIQSQKLLDKADYLATSQDGLRTNPLAGQKALEDASAFEAQGEQLGEQWRSLEASAADLEAQAKKTLARRAQAARKAMKKANPASMPAMTTDPESAYLPPLVLVAAPGPAPAAAPAASPAAGEMP